ncbi:MULTISPECIES: hypothetical protein [Ramlibacter]|uniref:DUF697 domain-containing protein n=1 Tax=Ramlibacter pinisoli TaxID=2682844 RepID=A0A6N8IVW7_9BURK|nr:MULTISPECIES: hypothetical protein [Ramlibacter]MBA2960747.1 hypothetical protein [Ramlibacter sp. CGMCC 1.13660]MVQ30695.1 hypothetical protein [Ramlibacter pinisoli]
MPSALQLAAGDPALLERVRACRRLLNRRALVGAAASAVPLPGLDFVVDAALLANLLPEINARFGLTPDQLARLPAHERQQVQKAVAVVGSAVIGRLVTRDLVLQVAGKVGMRLSAKRAARYVPIAGQAAAAVVGYAALRYLGEEHIKDCVRVVRDARLLLPPPSVAGHLPP